jgi:hypothetical protein
MELPGHPSLFTCDARVHDAIEFPELGWVTEDDGGESSAIEGSVGSKDVTAEASNNVSPGRLAGLHDLPGEQVGVHHDRPTILKQPGDRALAGRHASCEPGQQHGGRIDRRL